MRTLKTPVNVNYIDYFQFKSWGFILIFCIFAIFKVEAQINLASSSIYDSRPVLTNGEYLATDYNTVNRPLVLEAFATNAKIGVTSGSIYAPAAGRDSVFFGGDEPSDGFGAGAWPIYTKRVFKKSDFPIQMSCSFFSREDVPLYNESYLVLVPANYKYFATSTYYVDGQYTQREGLLFGGFPFRSQIFDNKGNSQSLVIRKDVTHNYALNGKWFTMEVYLYLSGNDLIIKYLKVDGSSVFPDDFNLGEFSYLDDFRLGIAADDMAHGFTIDKNGVEPEPIVADFDFPNPICEGECINFQDRSEVPSTSENVSYRWLFEGANPSSSDLQNPMDICYLQPGSQLATLIVSDGFQSDTMTQSVLVNPIPRISLGNDTIACQLGFELDARYPLAEHLWSDGSTEPTLSVNKIGKYWVNVRLKGCEFSDTVNVDSIVRSGIALGPDRTLCKGEREVLGTEMQSDWIYKWNTNESTREIGVSTSGTYHVEVYDGCWTYRDSINLVFGECADFKFHFPNAFTPNFDEINNVLKPVVLEGSCCTVRDYKMTVYNRWGELLFVSEDITKGWDGMYLDKDAQTDVYLCIIQFKHGLNFEIQKHSVHLVR
jgi:gliding motility-associated-like protein